MRNSFSVVLRPAFGIGLLTLFISPACEHAMAGVLPQTKAQRALADARHAEKAGDMVHARTVLSGLVRSSPNDVPALTEYATLLLRTGEAKQSLVYLERAKRLHPNDPEVLAVMGVAYDQVGDYSHAQQAYAHASAKNPGDPDILCNDAISHIKSGDLAGAQRLLTEAQERGAAASRVMRIGDMISQARQEHPDAARPPKPGDETKTPNDPVAPPARASLMPYEMSPARHFPAHETPSVNMHAGRYIIQAGAFENHKNAEHLASKLAKLGARVARTVRSGHDVSIVEFGPYNSMQLAQEAILRARKLGGDTFLIFKRDEQTAQKKFP